MRIQAAWDYDLIISNDHSERGESEIGVQILVGLGFGLHAIFHLFTLETSIYTK